MSVRMAIIALGGLLATAGTGMAQGVVTFGRPAWPTSTAGPVLNPTTGQYTTMPGYGPAPQPVQNYQPPIAPSPYPYAYPYINPTPYNPGFPATPAGGAVPQQQVDSWYRRYLRRAVDPSGLQAHVNAYYRGGPEAALSGILGSAEYYRIWGNTPRGFVSGLYSDILRRNPRPGEVDNWARQLNRWTKTQLAQEFLRQARLELGGPYY